MNNLTSNLTAVGAFARKFWAALITGILGLTGIVAMVPNSLQAQIEQPFPEAARGYIGVGFLVAAWVANTFAHAKAAALPAPEKPAA